MIIGDHLQKHFVRLGDRQGSFNQAMLHQDAMIRRYGQRRWTALLDVLVLFSVFHRPTGRKTSKN